MLNISGIEDKVKNIEERLVELVKNLEKLPNSIDEFFLVFGGHSTREDIEILDQMEELNGEEACNMWLAEVLVSTGRYVHAGKGFVDIKHETEETGPHYVITVTPAQP